MFCFVCFQEYNVHFAPFSLSILVANPSFLGPNYALFTPKIPLFNGYFALSSHVLRASRRLCLYHCSVFLCLSFCILQHFALRLASKHTAFSIKTQCVLRHFSLCLVPKCTAFYRILHCILLQIAVPLNKNTFWWHLQLSPFCIKTNLRENRFFATRRAVGAQKGQSVC